MKCAIKCIRKEDVLDCKLKTTSLVSEMAILKMVEHPSLIRTFELLSDDKNFYIVTELAQHGDLFNFYK